MNRYSLSERSESKGYLSKEVSLRQAQTIIILLRKLLTIILFLLNFVILTSPIKAQTQLLNTVIINQVRGTEACCQSGSPEMVETIISNPDYQAMPLNWAIRYDALTDQTFIDKLNKKPSSHWLGLLLEVTPELATDSGVILNLESKSNWSEARHAFLVGFTQVERQKVLDYLFAKFHQQFGYYPSFTAGWMIDGWSLDYIRSKYGVRVHEITKEQYETDGYTLYGGIFNLPYFPSKNHPLIPASRIDVSDLMILRQTVSDLDKNYGSAKSFYTSQPNDYLSQKPPAQFPYFQRLISDMQKQEEPTKVAVIGLENSSEWSKYKAEFLKQLDYIKELSDKNEVHVYSAYDFYREYSKNSGQPKARFLKTTDFPSAGKLWYFGSNYRAVIEIWEGLPVLTDLRIFGKFQDPYSDTKVRSSQAYWIVPYLLDSSQQFIAPENDVSPYRGNPVRSDEFVSRFGIRLADSPIIQLEQTENELLLMTENGSIKFEDKEIIIENTEPKFLTPVDLTLSEILELGTERFVFFPRHPRLFIIPQNQSIRVGWESKNLEQILMAEFFRQDNLWLIGPNLTLTQTDVGKLSSIFQPDRSDYGFDPAASIFFWHNTQAISGRNPIRLYINPLNIIKRPATIDNIEVRLTNPESIDYEIPVAGAQEPFFIDFTAKNPATTDVNLIINGNIINQKQTIQFVPDCLHSVTRCLISRDDGLVYLKIISNEIKQTLAEKAKDIFSAIKDRTQTLFQKANY